MKPVLEASSQIPSELCLLGESRACQGCGNINHHSRPSVRAAQLRSGAALSAHIILTTTLQSGCSRPSEEKGIQVHREGSRSHHSSSSSSVDSVLCFNHFPSCFSRIVEPIHHCLLWLLNRKGQVLSLTVEHDHFPC